MAKLHRYFRVEDIVGSVMFAAILAVSQAFGVGKNFHFVASFAIWVVVIFPVWMLVALPIRWVLQATQQSYLVGLMLAISTALLASIPQTLYIQFCIGLTLNQTIAFETTFIQVLTVSLSITILVYVLTGSAVRIASLDEANRNKASDLSENNSSAKLLTDQLPPEIGINITSIHAEDHYLRVVTDKGEALILMRLRDAIAAMSKDAGMQTHRSHWVSDASNPELVRQNGKPALMLDDGRTVPVSRHYLRAVRASLSARKP
ncbi:LytTR family DNA-binding domain-containing protein [Candidatus Puniceispirillum marinum]|uniref:LytTR family DNA-binding domain-containing protein n=1 Tax=Candidatus Puniceispirillum marinum TaxID=767892 RepID=UPI00167FCBE0|nr:LytTR family DNA-binding domain-containing protein [Candidatus Puniceispirillum marinum]